MANFSGTLNTNSFYGSLFNAYRLINTYADSLSGLDNSLAGKWKTDGGMYHDKSVFTSMDILPSRVWDPADTNVLAPEMRVKPAQQEIVVNKTRQIGLYTEKYMSKKAWMAPEVFEAFQAVVEAQVGKTKRVFESRKCNVYAGTTETSIGLQTQTITFATESGEGVTDEATPVTTTYTDTEKLNRLKGQAIAKKIADIMVGLTDSTRDFNDREFMDSCKEEDFDLIFSSEWYNALLYIDLPTIFHNDNLMKVWKNAKVLPARYCGNILTTTATADGSTHRALEEYKIRVTNLGAYSASGTYIKNVYPGDLLPSGTPIVALATAETTGSGSFTIDGNAYTLTYYSTVHAYVPDSKKICKIIHKDAVKFLSSFETSTEFWNPKNLSSNRYLTWNYADPDRLVHLPFVSLNEA